MAVYLVVMHTLFPGFIVLNEEQLAESICKCIVLLDTQEQYVTDLSCPLIFNRVRKSSYDLEVKYPNNASWMITLFYWDNLCFVYLSMRHFSFQIISASISAEIGVFQIFFCFISSCVKVWKLKCQCRNWSLQWHLLVLLAGLWYFLAYLSG